MAFATCLAVVGVLAVLTTLTGRLHVALLGPAWLRSFRPLEAAASSAIGTAWWTVLLTALSFRGFTIPSAVFLILVTHGLALGLVAWRHEIACLRPRRGTPSWRAFLLVALAVTLIGLLPVLRKGSFATANDSLTYCSFAQWLADHAGPEPVSWRPDEPIAYYPAIYRQARAPLAPAFLLAGTQAIARASSPLVVYPALSTFGLLLSVLGILVTGRWVLRWPARWLVPVGFALAALPGPLVWAHHTGFLAQTLGIPAFLLFVVLLARSLPPRRWSAAAALLLGLVTVWLATTYLAFLLVGLGAGGWWLLSSIRHARAVGRMPRLAVGLGVFAVAALGLLESTGVSLVRGLEFLGVSGVGFPVGLPPLGFLQLALGASLGTNVALEAWVEPLRVAHLWLTPLYASLVLVGAWQLAKLRRAGGIWASAAVLTLAAAYWGLWVLDPWTGERGHTWNLFKLAQWAHPLLLIAGIHGLLTIAAHRPLGRWVPWLAFIPIVLLSIHWGLAGALGSPLETFVGTARPLDQWPRLRRAFAGLPPGTLLAADRLRDSSQQLPTYLGLLAYPRRLVGDWTGSLWIAPDPDRRFEKLWATLGGGGPPVDLDPVVPIVTGLRGFITEAVEPLGGQLGRVREGDRPALLAILPSEDAGGSSGCVWLGRARTRAVFYSPGSVAAVLEMDGVPGPGVGGLGRRLLVDTPAAAFEARIDDFSRIRVPIRLRTGINHAEIRFPDFDRDVGDRRRLCVFRFGVR